MRVDRLAPFLLKPLARACKEFDLLAEGDRIGVAVSGGKDSRSLLDLLLRYQARVPFSYQLIAIHVVGTAAGFPDLRPQLEPWFEDLGVDHRFVPLALPPEEPLPLDCFRCSWNRRRTLFTAAVEHGCNKLALGHHADDAAATTLMNILFNGHLETMPPRLPFFEDAVTLIRPLIYVPQKKLADYAKASRFAETEGCPLGLTSQRAQAAAILRQFGSRQKQIRANLWRLARQTMGF